MNLRELEYLVAIDEERHFNRAAERCYVSQPTLSGQLKKLEDELGVLLVERSNRRVAMTEAGSVIADRARLILTQTKEIKDIAQRFQDPMMGELHLGLIPTVAPYLLPLIMPSLRKKFPAMKLWLHEYQTKVLLQKLRQSELDLLILALPVNTDEFMASDLYHEPFWLAMPKGAKLAKKTKVALQDLAEQKMLLLEEGHCLRGQALEVCVMAGASERGDFQATSLETLRHMVGEGMGMTLIPELAVAKHIRKDDNLRYIPFVDPPPQRRIGMLYRKGSYRSQTFSEIKGCVQAVIGSYLSI